MSGLASEAPLLVKGLGVMMGEWVLGPSGPILFHGLGLSAPAAATFGVLSGAVLGYFIAGKAWTIYHRHGAGHAGYSVAVDRHLGASLRL
jgi:hypothetical protein